MYAKTLRSISRWLCPTEFDRKRAVDTSERVRKARTGVALLTGLAVALLVPSLGWLPVVFFVIVFVYLAGLDRRMERSRFPEIQAAAGMFTTSTAIVASIAVTGGPKSPVLPLLALPIAMIAARFRPQVVFTGVAGAVLSIVAVGFAVDASYLIHHPGDSLVAIIVIIGSAAIATAIQGAEVQHRHESVIDPLTGTLNRKALDSRFHEIEEQAHLSGGSVCMVEFDLDYFKRVNDFLGHERGDAVLRDMAYEVRKSLRTFELLYRIGGEEFLIVLPGAHLADAMDIAERIRLLVLERRPAGVEITVSLGVAHASGSEVEFASLYAQADEALYQAKRNGRNQVAAASTPNYQLAPLAG